MDFKIFLFVGVHPNGAKVASIGAPSISSAWPLSVNSMSAKGHFPQINFVLFSNAPAPSIFKFCE